MFESFNKYNILTVDIWVASALLILFSIAMPPTSITYSQSSQTTTMIGGVLSIAYIIACCMIALLCTKLRGYRYLDIYVECSKIFNPISIPYKIYAVLLLGAITTLFLIVISHISIYDLVPPIYIALLSIHLNNSKNLKLVEVVDSISFVDTEQKDNNE